MYKRLREKCLYNAFLVTVFLKGLTGVVAIALGLLLMFTDEFSNVVFFLTRNELIEDPNDYFATHLRAFASQSHEAFFIGGLYLVADGAVKAFISGMLWKGFSWAYPAAMALLGIFILYEFVRIIQTGSVPLMCLAFFDVVMLTLVGYEYKKIARRA